MILVFAYILLYLTRSYSAQGVSYPSISIPIRTLFNNQAASPNGSANFDGQGASFDSTLLPPGPLIYDGIKYDLPSKWGINDDNVIADNQVIKLAKPSFAHELHLLYAGDGNGPEFVANFNLAFEDNSTQPVQLYSKNYYRWPNLNVGAIKTPYHFTDHGSKKDFNATWIYQWSTSVLSEKRLVSVTFPPIDNAHRLHVFAISLTQSSSSTIRTNTGNKGGSRKPASPALSVRRVKFTNRWEFIGNQRAQAVEVTLANLLPSHLLGVSTDTAVRSTHQINLSGSGIRTLRSGVFHRLIPGDQVRVDVFVSGTLSGGVAKVQVINNAGQTVLSEGGFGTSALVERWTPDSDVLSTHESPTWAPPSTYAEWYDWSLHVPGSGTQQHHLETYGKNVHYDDFFSNFTASKFNASSWVDLFDRAGAKYFVLVTKHHDGFALFDTGNTSHRNSLEYGPKRDLVAELLETAKKEKPDLHRGTYFSMPEWFHPDYAKYGFVTWPGGLAHNPFNSSQLEPYTGYANISDFIDDLQYPQMLDLALKYDTEIMWCDIGGPNKTLEFAAQFYNHALENGRQVTMNDRCGAVPDFDTPEYATFGSIQTRDWESSEGMDPFSYGLNTATTSDEYLNGTGIVQTLVDIVSKNGNFLLDIGPTAEGEIIAPMAANLLDAGEWLGYAGDCVYSTTYWFPTSQDLGALIPSRFTTTPTSFCITSFEKPVNQMLVISTRLPILPEDEIVLLKPGGPSASLPWIVDDATGHLVVNVTESDLQAVKHAWVFKVNYQV
ncbi:hypothetical protein ONZ45_g13706 [Pleurotus djamor]|nr:hypothetical protein ONZ45_g13706 [Pleurotus djamor]